MSLLSLLVISTVAAENCSYTFEGSSYSRSAILTIKGLPTNLAYDPKTESLLFTLIDMETLNNDDTQTKMDQYILNNRVPIKIDNVKGQCAAVDTKNNKIYIATDDGLTELNNNNKANFVSMKDEDIVQIFKPANKDVLYATFFPENELYEIDLIKNEKTKVENVPCAYFIAVDDKDNIYYECNSKYVKVLLKGFQEPIEFVGLPKNSGRAIAVDHYFRAILATNDGLYHLRADSMIPVKLMNLDFTPSSLVFDEDNFYIATKNVIYKYSMEGCDVDDTTTANNKLII